MGNKGSEPMGCNNDGQKIEAVKENNLTLYLSNESSERGPIDIQLFIDGQLMVDTILEYKFHTRSRFGFTIEKGDHQVQLVSQSGEAILEKKITIVEKHWMAIWYFYTTGKKGGAVIDPVFSFKFQDHPIYFR